MGIGQLRAGGPTPLAAQPARHHLLAEAEGPSGERSQAGVRIEAAPDLDQRLWVRSSSSWSVNGRRAPVQHAQIARGRSCAPRSACAPARSRRAPRAWHSPGRAMLSPRARRSADFGGEWRLERIVGTGHRHEASRARRLTSRASGTAARQVPHRWGVWPDGRAQPNFRPIRRRPNDSHDRQGESRELWRRSARLPLIEGKRSAHGARASPSPYFQTHHPS
jgi:hypothetical protein